MFLPSHLLYIPLLGAVVQSFPLNPRALDAETSNTTHDHEIVIKGAKIVNVTTSPYFQFSFTDKLSGASDSASNSTLCSIGLPGFKGPPTNFSIDWPPGDYYSCDRKTFGFNFSKPAAGDDPGINMTFMHTVSIDNDPTYIHIARLRLSPATSWPMSIFDIHGKDPKIATSAYAQSDDPDTRRGLVVPGAFALAPGGWEGDTYNNSYISRTAGYFVSRPDYFPSFNRSSSELQDVYEVGSR